MKFALKLPSFPAKATPPIAEEAEEGSFIARLFERKRMLRVAMLFIIAGSAGQIMQVMQARTEAQRQAMAQAQAEAAKPVEITSLSGDKDPNAPMATSDEISGMMQAAAESAAMGLPTLPEQLQETPVTMAAAAPMAQAAPDMPKPTVQTATLAALTLPSETAPAETVPAQTAPAPLAAEGAACAVTLDLAVVPGGMINVTLLAPCVPNARVVLQHEGLAVTGLTSAAGSLFTALPALTPQAKIVAVLADGSKIESLVVVPEAADFRRFGVQWQGDDAFQVMAYEDGAAFGTKGHIFGVQPGQSSDAGGFLQILGNPDAPMPLLAEVYTYPKGETPVDVVVESAVTAKTCGRELLGETLMATAGEVLVTDLTLAMPDCAAIGDFLVLNNLALDMTLAAN